MATDDRHVDAASSFGATRGYAVLHDAALNKGTAFSVEERRQLGLAGLLPAQVDTQEMQVRRVLGNLRRKAYDIERYIFLMSLQRRNERLFYRTVLDNLEEILPLIYTPTVGQACREYAHIFREPKGFTVTADDRGRVREILRNWPERDVRVIVVTDGQRILGLGDLGANGMGIPVGKLALYTACAGIRPAQGLPVMLDVGTENQELLDDPLYLGLRRRRLAGDAYDELVEEFVTAVQETFPEALIQFEDFLTPNAYRLLDRYRDRVLCFNDDIQGTAAVALAGVLASTRISGLPFRDLRILFLGAGSAATGIADLIARALTAEGLSEEQARRRLSFVDSKGLVVAERENLAPHKQPYAHDHPPADFLGALRAIRPQVLIGATGHGGDFTRPVIETMCELNPRPTIFALSNPTSHAECTAEQAYEWSDGRAIFAGGSPFPPHTRDGATFRPGQGNNAYVFPGIGLGALVSRASRISDEMFLAAATALAGMVGAADLAAGSVYPPLAEIRRISARVAAATADRAYEQGLARAPRPDDLEAATTEAMYDPSY